MLSQLVLWMYTSMMTFVECWLTLFLHIFSQNPSNFNLLNFAFFLLIISYFFFVDRLKSLSEVWNQPELNQLPVENFENVLNWKCSGNHRENKTPLLFIFTTWMYRNIFFLVFWWGGAGRRKNEVLINAKPFKLYYISFVILLQFY